MEPAGARVEPPGLPAATTSAPIGGRRTSGRRAESCSLVGCGPEAIFIDSADPDEAIALASLVRRAARRRQLPPVRDVVPGDGGVLLDGVVDRSATTRALAELLRGGLPSGEAPTGDARDVGWAAEAERGRDLGQSEVDAPDVVVLPTCYDGPDLEVVARLWGCSPEAVVARHLATRYRVAFVGFAPGFGYLVGDPPLPDTPRRSEPRSVVPAGAVGVAGPYSGVYPRVSPGGWQLIGRCIRAVFDVTARPPVLLRPGCRVRFVPADREPPASRAARGVALGRPDQGRSGPLEDDQLSTVPVEEPIGGPAVEDEEVLRRTLACQAAATSNGVGPGPVPTDSGRLDRAGDHSEAAGSQPASPRRAADAVREVRCGRGAMVEDQADLLCVVRSGALTTVQDRGRPGLAHLGVPASGALDAAAAALANRLLGNAPGAATLETTVDGVGLVALAPCRVVVTGAPASVTVDGRAAPYGEPITLWPDAHLEVGRARYGVRSYVGVAGGIRTPPVLGSRSHDRLSGIGPPPLEAGDRLPVGRLRRRRWPAAVGYGPFGLVATGGPASRGPAGEAEVVVWRPTVLWGVGPAGAGWPWPFDRASDLPDALWFRVGASSSRIGVVLEPAFGCGSAGGGAGRGAAPAGTGGSLPLPAGAVELLPSGGVVVFLADRPTTGGYPLLGVVDDRGRQRLAQTPVGATVRLYLAARSG